MSAQFFIERSQKALDDQILQVTHPLVHGQLQTIEQYRQQCGNLLGLRQAKEILSAVYKATYEATEVNNGNGE